MLGSAEFKTVFNHFKTTTTLAVWLPELQLAKPMLRL
jgi:hypothetical protein